jgi:hypothetical protein
MKTSDIFFVLLFLLLAFLFFFAFGIRDCEQIRARYRFFPVFFPRLSDDKSVQSVFHPRDFLRVSQGN